MHDIILPTSDGRVTQIDHLLLGPDGVHVIETKRLSGFLDGHAEDEKWQQRFSADRPDAPARMIYSPIRQNQGHCRAVYGIIRLVDAGICVTSNVVMTGTAILSPALLSQTLTGKELNDLIDGFDGKKPTSLLVTAWERLLDAADTYEARRGETQQSP